MEEEIIQLKEQLEKERARCAALENDLDDLAIDNDRLRKLLAAGGSSNVTGFTSRNVTSHSTNVGGGVIGNFASGAAGSSSDPNFEWRDLLVDGDNNCADVVHTKVENACGGMNVLSVAFCVCPGTELAVACGGVDKTVRIYGIPAGEEGEFIPQVLRSYPLSAPVLSMDSHGYMLACSLMDGGHAVIDTSATDPSSSSSSSSSVTVYRDHSKYVVSVKWSPDGAFLATVSHDKTVNLYKRSLISTGEISMVKVHTARFMVTPECAVFAKNSSAASAKHTAASAASSSEAESSSEEGALGYLNSVGEKDAEAEGSEVEWELIIALRDTPHLTYLHCGTYAQRFVTVNEAVWDTHCSFTPLHLAISPNKKYLLVATDKNFHFIVQIGCSKRLRFFAGGHSCGDFGKPKVSFDPTGRYVYCNNEEGSSVCVYSVSTEKPVRSLSVHTGSVRDVVCHPTRLLVATASYDKSVIVWAAPTPAPAPAL